MILKVARLGHPVLRLKAKPVNPAKIRTPDFQTLLRDMVETMREHDGVGIAAPQVHVSLQVAAIQVDHNPRYRRAPKIPLVILINLKIRPVERGKSLDWEGCLSVEGLRGRVPRWKRVAVQAYNAKGEPVSFKAAGFFARVIQHEWDHLQGKVFLDRMTDFSTLTHLTEFSRYWAR